MNIDSRNKRGSTEPTQNDYHFLPLLHVSVYTLSYFSDRVPQCGKKREMNEKVKKMS